MDLFQVAFPFVVIHKTGRFYKTAAINEAADSVQNNNSIIFLLDLHLELPVNLIQTLRKVSTSLLIIPVGGSLEILHFKMYDVQYCLNCKYVFFPHLSTQSKDTWLSFQ